MGHLIELHSERELEQRVERDALASGGDRGGGARAAGRARRRGGAGGDNRGGGNEQRRRDSDREQLPRGGTAHVFQRWLAGVNVASPTDQV